MTTIAERLEESRHELLDLSLRNSLLNFRPLKARGIEVIDESPVELFRILVEENRSMTFLPAESAPVMEDDSALFDDDDEIARALAGATDEEVSERHRDSRIQTPHAPAALEKRLLNTYHAARTAVEEQGVNVLYLALGMLRWSPSSSDERILSAPLLLVPVRLERDSVRTKFRLQHTGEDHGTNASLEALLRRDFSIEAPERDEDEPIAAYFDRMAERIADQPRWSVDRSAATIGFFSFTRFLMYEDLDPARWPSDAPPHEHPLLAALLGQGFQESSPAIEEEEFLDDRLAVGELGEILDADSSQMLAVHDALSGRNLVIQGPPGTGKSQTIANLLAAAVMRGKTVLFVAEKMAALEVVKRRLDAAKVGGACLELHSHRTSRKDVVDEVRRAWKGTSRAGPDRDALHACQAIRTRLNAASQALHAAEAETGLSPYECYGRLVELGRRLEGAERPRLESVRTSQWSRHDFSERAALAKEMQSLLVTVGIPAKHPFFGIERSSCLPSDVEALKTAAKRGGEALAALRSSSGELAARTGFARPESPDAAERLGGAVERMLEAPPLKGVALRNEAWLLRPEEIRRTLASGAEWAEVHRQFADRLLPHAWSEHLREERGILADCGDRWWRFFLPSWHRVRRRLAGICRRGLPRTNAERLAVVDAVLLAQDLARSVDDGDELLADLFGRRSYDAAAAWDYLRAAADYLVATWERIEAGELPEGFIERLAAFDPARGSRALLDEMRGALDEWRRRRMEVLSALGMTSSGASLRRFEDRGAWEELDTTLRSWIDGAPRLHEMALFNVMRRRMEDQGLTEAAVLAETWEPAVRLLDAAVENARVEGILERTFAKRPELAGFSGAMHDADVDRFCELDRLVLETNRALVNAAHAAGLPDRAGRGEEAIIRRETEKQRQHLPIRRLIERAGRALQAIKPIFMMSPLSVAMYLPPGAVTFDLVVFDEASQVRPVDAIGSFLRARQAIVVGDHRQLPPTAFFERLGVEGEAEERDGEMRTGEFESVLETMTAQGCPERMLRWHYRSRHESLIAVSNRRFYDDRLVLFPSPVKRRADLGVTFRHLPEAWYEPGAGRNRIEAHAVAAAAMEHAKTRPAESLGIAAFSIRQMQAIIDALEVMRRADPSCESFFGACEEPFFIKNLENVQGDERDAIFISLGYGRTKEGVLSMNFGPLNQRGGERRLNVLITRARRRCVVFGNLTDEEIDPTRTHAAGALALKDYLRFARTGVMEADEKMQSGVAGLLERSVADALGKAGHEVETGVGQAGCFVDVAVAAAGDPGRFKLGIECDGFSHLAARTARDRHRLRQTVLEDLGWRIHRFWSTEWFRDAPRELGRIQERLKKVD